MISAIIIYIVLGLIAWNIVCSFLDIESTPIISLSDYRLYTYSAIAGIFTYFVSTADNDEFTTLLFVIAIGNLGIAILTNHWESAWDNVISILTFIYNIINVGLMTTAIYSRIK